MLASVQEALGADVVFWYPGASGEPPEAIGPGGVTAWHSRDFAERILDGAATASGQVLCTFLDPAARPIALGYWEQIGTFLASDGMEIIHPEPAAYFETPIQGPLPEGLSFIP